jgi:type IV pilus assembly protein PilQ
MKFYYISVMIAFFAVAGSPVCAAPQVFTPQVARSGGPIIDELALKDADISRAIEVIAGKSGLNIITGQDVKGKVTIFLKKVAAREALRIVLESNGLAFADDGGIIRVMTAGEFLDKYGHAFGEDTASRLVRLNFASPADAAKLLEEMKSPRGKVVVNAEARTVFLMDTTAKVRAMEDFLAGFDVELTRAAITLKNIKASDIVADVRRMLTPGVGTVEVDASANALNVTDAAARLEHVRKALEAADARGRVLVLEAKLVRILLNNEHPMGVDWAGILDDMQRLRLWGRYEFLAGPDGGRALSLGMILNDDFSTLVEALDTVGVVEEYPLSSVHVAGSDDVLVEVRLDSPSITMTVRAPGAPEDLHGILPGARGVATPVAISFMVRSGFDVTGDIVTTVVPLPGSVRDARANNISAREGYTAVIGGILTAERTAAAHKIPLLGDLPLLGVAFRMEGAVRREEFAVFLTPRSVSLSQALTDEAGVSDAIFTGGE